MKKVLFVGDKKHFDEINKAIVRWFEQNNKELDVNLVYEPSSEKGFTTFSFGEMDGLIMDNLANAEYMPTHELLKYSREATATKGIPIYVLSAAENSYILKNMGASRVFRRYLNADLAFQIADNLITDLSITHSPVKG